MFLPPKLTTIVVNSLALLLLLAGSTDAQQSEFNRRAMAMQEARARAQQPATVRLASNDDDIGIDYSAPPSPPTATRIASAPQGTLTRQSNNSPVRRGSPGQLQRPPQRIAQGPINGGQVASRYVPEHLRTAQVMQSAIVDGGAPIVDNSAASSQIYEGEIVGGEIIDGGCTSCGSCGDVGGFFNECDSCCGRGGCLPGECWLFGFGKVLREGEYFGGVQSFRGPQFNVPGVGNVPGTNVPGVDFNDSSFGLYQGFNFGLPLCRLSCGLFTTQFGFRATQTNFNGNAFTVEDRKQYFMTLGFFRRVDYGFQSGIAIDYLREQWFSDFDVAQFRGDLSWVFPGGTTMGFRYATNIEEDVTAGVVNVSAGPGNSTPVAFAGQVVSTSDLYRFYGRRETAGGGFGNAFVGWTGDSQTVFGMDYDLPVRDRIALRSGFAYFLGDSGLVPPTDQAGGNANDAFNIYFGLVFRPRGLSYNRSYDRPLFSVADNGTMLISRQ